jgi:16S rRNA (guanine527-N7)-methyltransferase
MTAERAEMSDCLARAGITVSDQHAERLVAFAGLLEKWNRVYNLTGIRDRKTLLERHFVESLILGPLLRGERIADVGTGAGLPGMPLAIVHPERSFTLIESRRKRVNFLRHVIAELGLRNVEVAHCRAEDLPSTEPFATVLARAVAAPAQLLQIIRPLTGPGSVLVLLTSAELSRQIVRIADDFVEASAQEGDGKGLKSSIVVLERSGLPGERSEQLGNSDG